jgi:alpha-tubulin suppressor-like RCC1 family protein
MTNADGVKCWGYNANGQVGDGTTTERHTPEFVDGFRRGRAVGVASGNFHNCVVTTVGGIKCWGLNANGQLGDGTNIERHTPIFVDGLTAGMATVAGGGDHSCAVSENGRIECWGWNANGQLGDGTTTERHTPEIVDGFTRGAADVAAGYTHTCALTRAGAVKCWGWNGHGQLGDGTLTERHTPISVIPRGIKAIAAGAHHTCALTNAGAVKCWGNNDSGQLGDGTRRDRRSPISVPGLTHGVKAIAAGSFHTCAITGQGGVKCWGWNDFGQIGDGTLTERRSPVFVDGLTRGADVIAAGYAHTCAKVNARRVICWGANGNGQLGDGTTTGRRTPTIVDGFF